MIYTIDTEQTVSISWNKANRDYYIDKGYTCDEDHKNIVVKVSDLLCNSLATVHVNCDICGKPQDVRYRTYNSNITRNGRYVCQSCSVQVRHDKNVANRSKKHISKLMKVCEADGYTLLSTVDEIKRNTSYIRYLCPIHGEQSMRLNNLINGRKCPECGMDNRRELYKLSTEEVVSRISQCGGIVLNPEEYKNQSERNLKFICPDCGKTFTSSLVLFTQHGGQVCKECAGNESIGEKKIRYFLESHNIEFKQQYWFKDCRDIHPLPFDFYLPTRQTIIEFDGKQHYVDNSFFKYSYKHVQLHDTIKNDYCKKNNIRLIRIPYGKINSIDKILNNELFT